MLGMPLGSGPTGQRRHAVASSALRARRVKGQAVEDHALSLRRLLNIIESFGPIVSLKQFGDAEPDLRRRVCRLRRHGLATTATLYDPSRLGQPISCISLVRLARHSKPAVLEFEARCSADLSVTAASRVLGRFDYQIATNHADVRSADGWRKEIQTLEAVAVVDMRFVRPIKGCGVAGLVILD